MPVNQNNYNERGGGNLGIIVRCPNIVADRLVYFDKNPDRESWVIRDFITGQQLANGNSRLNIEQIEEDANHDEFPPWIGVDRTDDWSVYLILRTTAVFRIRELSRTAPNPVSGI